MGGRLRGLFGCLFFFFIYTAVIPRSEGIPAIRAGGGSARGALSGTGSSWKRGRAGARGRKAPQDGEEHRGAELRPAPR